MTNIRTRLIHLLGGVTKKESDSNIAMAKIDGSRRALLQTLYVMNDAYGNPKWGHIVYSFVMDYLEDLGKV